MDEAVLRGNSAILKCHIPSFVADFIQVASWVEDEEREILPSSNDQIQSGNYLKTFKDSENEDKIKKSYTKSYLIKKHLSY